MGIVGTVERTSLGTIMACLEDEGLGKLTIAVQWREAELII